MFALALYLRATNIAGLVRTMLLPVNVAIETPEPLALFAMVIGLLLETQCKKIT